MGREALSGNDALGEFGSKPGSSFTVTVFGLTNKNPALIMIKKRSGKEQAVSTGSHDYRLNNDFVPTVLRGSQSYLVPK